MLWFFVFEQLPRAKIIIDHTTLIKYTICIAFPSKHPLTFTRQSQWHMFCSLQTIQYESVDDIFLFCIVFAEWGGMKSSSVAYISNESIHVHKIKRKRSCEIIKINRYLIIIYIFILNFYFKSDIDFKYQSVNILVWRTRAKLLFYTQCKSMRPFLGTKNVICTISFSLPQAQKFWLLQINKIYLY